MIALRAVTKRFGGVVALDRVSIDVVAGATRWFTRLNGADQQLPWNMVGSVDFTYVHGMNALYITDDNLAGPMGTLIGADLGSTTTQEVLGKLREKADRKQIKDVTELKRLLIESARALGYATAIVQRWYRDAVPNGGSIQIEPIARTFDEIAAAQQVSIATWRTLPPGSGAATSSAG